MTDWETIERLEEVDPSPDDGSWGGDYCRHGRYVGTPGGGDYMCGLCEEGLDRWVRDPLFGVMLTFGVEAGAFDNRRLVQVWFRESQGITEAWNRLYEKAVELEVFWEQNPAVLKLFWEVRKFEDGYWTD